MKKRSCRSEVLREASYSIEARGGVDWWLTRRAVEKAEGENGRWLAEGIDRKFGVFGNRERGGYSVS